MLISNEINKIIEEVSEVKIVMLVTDNFSNMKSAWKIPYGNVLIYVILVTMRMDLICYLETFPKFKLFNN